MNYSSISNENFGRTMLDVLVNSVWQDSAGLPPFDQQGGETNLSNQISGRIK